ncbi:hypothetical protein CSUI_008147 [Cystoisospora suis]|uniref:Uncharacterized protein n=1 Tax=Cystoisospora suis TaxID=483139 RepID=A0A2C6KKE5_9APIC|nr:hypothetical protein CSUI_008147 [Cystoisospora suis]
MHAAADEEAARSTKASTMKERLGAPQPYAGKAVRCRLRLSGGTNRLKAYMLRL